MGITSMSDCKILYLKMKWFFVRFCLFVSIFFCTLYKSTFLNRFQPNFATRLPLRLEKVVGYVSTHTIWPFSTSSVRSQCRILGTTWLPAQESLRQRYIRDQADDTCAKSHPWCSRRQLLQESSAIALYPWYSRWHNEEKWTECKCVNMETWWDRKEVNTELQLQLHLILAGVPLTSRKWRRSRRESHPPRRRIPYSGGCSRHVTDITFNRATGPSATALYPSSQILFLWPTVNHVLADNSCAFLNQVCCTVGNAYDTLGRERDPFVFNSEPHHTGRKWLRNYNYTNNV